LPQRVVPSRIVKDETGNAISLREKHSRFQSIILQ